MPYSFHDLIKAWAKSLLGLAAGGFMWYVFSSWFVAVLTAAFFFFVPISANRLEANVNRAIFGGAMLVLLFWAFGVFGVGLGLDLGITMSLASPGMILFLVAIVAGVVAGITRNSGAALLAMVAFIAAIYFMQPWTWSTSAIIFVGIWALSMAIGMSGNVQSRAAFGVFVIVISLVIYAGGVGTNDVGTAFFGEWWPTVHNFYTSIADPITTALAPLWGTIGNAWQMMSNPVGFATQLMNGSYASNPLGQTGVHGVDIVSFDVGQAYVNQPFVISATFKNNGASKATDVNTKLEIDSTRLPVYSGATDTEGLTDIKQIYITDNEQKVGSGTMDKIGMAQNVFTSNKGITCNLVNHYDRAGGLNLRSKVIPLKLTTTYNYQSDSHVSIEFISQSEWERLANENKLQLKDVQSEYSSAPVKFPIGTAGLKQPILAVFQQFNIGLRIDAEVTNSKINNVTKVLLNYPTDFKIKGKCTPEGTVDENTGTVTWDNLNGEGTKILFCNFEMLAKDKMGNSATKTYEITAHAEYTFSNWRTADMKLEFGGVCCGSKDCLTGQVCHDCTCMPNGEDNGCAAAGTSTTNICTDPVKGTAGYCTTPKPCEWGWGGCKDSTVCNDAIRANGFASTPVTCMPVPGTDLNVNICCQTGNEAECAKKFNSWCNPSTP